MRFYEEEKNSPLKKVNSQSITTKSNTFSIRYIHLKKHINNMHDGSNKSDVANCNKYEQWTRYL